MVVRAFRLLACTGFLNPTAVGPFVVLGLCIVKASAAALLFFPAAAAALNVSGFSCRIILGADFFTPTLYHNAVTEPSNATASRAAAAPAAAALLLYCSLFY